MNQSVTIDTNLAAIYLEQNFTLSGEAKRLCYSIFEYWNKHLCASKKKCVSYLVEMLDAIGFDADDAQRLLDRQNSTLY